MMKNKDFEDDGRTVADMSGLSRQPLFIPKIKREESKKSGESLTPSQRRMYIFGALGASLLIGLAFATGLGLIILIMYLLFL